MRVRKGTCKVGAGVEGRPVKEGKINCVNMKPVTVYLSLERKGKRQAPRQVPGKDKVSI